MFSFKQFILIIEAKIDDLKSSIGQISTEHDPDGKFTEPSDIVDHFHSHNPTGDVNHTRWVVNQYHQGNLKQEDAPSMKDTLTDFNRFRNNLHKKQINQYKTLSDLRDAIRPFSEAKRKQTFTLSNQEFKDVQNGSTLVHESPNVSLYHVHNKEAACALGKDMPWCTSRQDNKNMFDHYNKETNKRFYIAHLPNEQAPYRKLGIGIGANEFQDENNTNISHENLIDLVKRNPELKKIPVLQGSRYAVTEIPEKYPELVKNDLDGMKKMDYTDDQITNLMKHKDPEIRSSIILHPNASSKHADIGIKDKNYDVRLSTLFSKASTEKHFVDAVNSPFSEYRSAIASNPKATKKFIDTLINDNESEVRGSLGKNPNLTKEHIDTLVNDKSGFVRQMIANNPNLTKEHIDKLIKDNDWSVRSWLAENPNLSKEHIDTLMNDESEYVRSSAVGNKNSDKEHIDIGLKDEHPDVVKAAKRRAEKIGIKV